LSKVTEKIDTKAGWRELVLYLVVAIVPWGFFAPALDFEFASDDRIMIVENTYMRDPANWWRMLSTDAFDRTIQGFSYEVTSLVGHWRPINKLSYLIDYSFWGPDSARFHLTGLLIHLVAGCLLVWLCRILGMSRIAAGAGGLVFLLHPIVARPLGLISLRADLWCGLFSLLTVASAVRARMEGGYPTGRFFLLSYASAFLALLGKETALFLPLFFSLFYFCMGEDRVHPVRRAIVGSWPYFAIVGVYSFVRFVLFSIPIGTQNEFPPMSIWTLFMSLSRLAFSYLSEVFVPTLIDRIWLPEILTGWPDGSVMLAWGCLLALAWVVVRIWRRREERPFLGILLLVLPILPLLKIDAISGEDVGELLPFEAHRLYISIMGLAVLWGVLFDASKSWSKGIRGGILALLAGAFIAYPGLFPRELSVYRDTESIVKRKVDNIQNFANAKLPTSLRILQLNQEAIELKRQEKYGEAVEVLQRILEIKPYDAVALKNLGVISLLQKRPERAIEYLQTVLQPVPYKAADGSVRMVIDDPQLRHTGTVQKVLGQAYQMKAQYDTAREHFLLAAEIDPTDTEVLLMLAWNATLRGDVPGARDFLERFLQAAPADDSRRSFALRKLRELKGGKGAVSEGR
jgi:tetratricopeptide (TPR) repeat protein